MPIVNEKEQIQILTRNANRIIIFGAGGEGAACYRWLKIFGKTPDYFVDNNLACQNSLVSKTKLKIPVFSPLELKKEKGALIFIANKTNSTEMGNYLGMLGVISKNTIVNFTKYYLTEGEKVVTNDFSVVNKIKTHKKSENPKISIIVPVYRVDKFLTPCLSSIVDQTLEDIEIIIVDEGDEDRCREIIDYFEKIDPRIVAPHKKHGGYGKSCNYGIDIARGEYLMFVESDDKIRLNMCEEMYTYAKQLDADVVKTPFVMWDGRYGYEDCDYRDYLAEQLPQGKLFSVKEFNLPLLVHASLWSGIYKTDYMRENKIRFIEAKGGAYVDVGFRIDTLINTEKMAWLDIPYYIYRTTNEESTTNNFNLTSMLHRWNEVHNQMKLLQDDYDKYYGKALIWDEYMNTLNYVYCLKIIPDKEQLDLLIENFSYVSEAVIRECPKLDDDVIESIMEFKNDPEKYVDKRKKEKEIYDSLTAKYNNMLEAYLISKSSLRKINKVLRKYEFTTRGKVLLEDKIYERE